MISIIEKFKHINQEIKLKLDDFEPDAHDILKECICKVCNEVFTNPIILSNGNSSCFQCFIDFNLNPNLIEIINFSVERDNLENLADDNQSSDSLYCPISKWKVDPDKIIRMKFIEEKISKFLVFCRNIKLNCLWKGKVPELYKHLKECPKAAVKCSNKTCDYEDLRENIILHETQECDYISKNCRFCGIEHFVFETGKHLEICAEYIIDCIENCGIQIKRSLMEYHLKEVCTNTLVNCPFSIGGNCNDLVRRKDFADHFYRKIHLHFVPIFGAFHKFNQDSSLFDHLFQQNFQQLSKKIDKNHEEIQFMHQDNPKKQGNEEIKEILVGVGKKVEIIDEKLENFKSNFIFNINDIRENKNDIFDLVTVDIQQNLENINDSIKEKENLKFLIEQKFADVSQKIELMEKNQTDFLRKFSKIEEHSNKLRIENLMFSIDSANSSNFVNARPYEISEKFTKPDNINIDKLAFFEEFKNQAMTNENKLMNKKRKKECLIPPENIVFIKGKKYPKHLEKKMNALNDGFLLDSHSENVKINESVLFESDESMCFSPNFNSTEENRNHSDKLDCWGFDIVFDPIYASKYLKIHDNTVKAIGSDKMHKFIFLNRVLDKVPFEFEIQINQLSGWIAFGAAHFKVVKKNKFQFRGIPFNNHGCFLVSFEKNKNFFWNCKNRDQNNSNPNNIMLSNGDKIKFFYDPETASIELLANSFKFKIKDVNPRKNDFLQPCILFTNPEDEIGIYCTTFSRFE